MSQFSRRARWLNALFPASVAPQSSDPAVVSDDVSLVQPFDGSGWGIPSLVEWIKTVDGSGVTASTPIFTVPDDQVYRLFAASAFQVVGPGPQAQIFVRDNTSTPNKAVSLSAFFAITVNNLNFPLATALVIGPGLVISGEQFNGGAASIVRFSIYGCVAPLGTAFYC